MEDKIFFKPGDLVTLRQPLPNKPIMMVVRIEKSIIRNPEGIDNLKGIRCRWFTDSGVLQEEIFSTKDLIFSK